MEETYECKFREIKKTNREFQRYIATEVRKTLDKVKIMSPQRIFGKCRKYFLFLEHFAMVENSVFPSNRHSCIK